MINPWVQFILSAALVVFAGSKLAKNATVVADRTGIGAIWMGALMLPLATSFPEMVTTIRSVLIDSPDMAMGNILGSCLHNLALLVVIDLLGGRGALSTRLNQGHVITASLSIIAVCLACIAMLRVFLIPVGWIGIEALLIAILYLFGNRLVFKYEYKKLALNSVGNATKNNQKSRFLVKDILRFLAAAGVVVIAGALLTDASDQIAFDTGLGHSFVGFIFLAVSTTLPEIVTTIAAARLGFLDMAVANVFGSNFMNLFIIFLADVFFRRAPLLYSVAEINLLSAVMVIMLNVIFIIGLVYCSKKEIALLGYGTFFILVGYLTTIYLVFKFGGY